jgi:hypothetical protein
MQAHQAFEEWRCDYNQIRAFEHRPDSCCNWMKFAGKVTDDNTARNFLAGLCLVIALCYCIN